MEENDNDDVLEGLADALLDEVEEDGDDLEDFLKDPEDDDADEDTLDIPYEDEY